MGGGGGCGGLWGQAPSGGLASPWLASCQSKFVSLTLVLFGFSARIVLIVWTMGVDYIWPVWPPGAAVRHALHPFCHHLFPALNTTARNPVSQLHPVPPPFDPSTTLIFNENPFPLFRLVAWRNMFVLFLIIRRLTPSINEWTGPTSPEGLSRMRFSCLWIHPLLSVLPDWWGTLNSRLITN